MVRLARSLYVVESDAPIDHVCLLPTCTVTHRSVSRAVSAVVDGLKYQGSHEWVKDGGDTVTVGVSDFAQVSIVSVVDRAAGTDAPGICGRSLQTSSTINHFQSS